MSKTDKHRNNTIESNVMDSIKSGQAKMRPKYYYSLLALLGVIFISLFVFVSVYLFSVLSLWLRVITAEGPAYGANRNLTALSSTFPWWAAVLSVIFIAIIVVIIKKFGYLYKIRLVYLIPIIIAILAIVGFATSYSNLPSLLNPRSNSICSSSDESCTIMRNMYGRNHK